jgi:4-hydroxy-tetrahydrodipicolinate reductase
MLQVAMFGATGRMGRSIVPLLAASADLRLSGALAAPADPAIGHDAGVIAGTTPLAVSVTGDPDRALDGAGVCIDFTLAAATAEHARRCLARAVPMVIGTTGHDEPSLAELRRIAGRLPVVMAPNMSLGVNLLLKLAELAARALDGQYDAEIFESHHRHKVDAPSGTALGLGRASVAAAWRVCSGSRKLPNLARGP